MAGHDLRSAPDHHLLGVAAHPQLVISGSAGAADGQPPAATRRSIGMPNDGAGARADAAWNDAVVGCVRGGCDNRLKVRGRSRKTRHNLMKTLRLFCVTLALLIWTSISNLTHADPDPYMGTASDQRLFESVRMRCWETAYEKSEHLSVTSLYNFVYARCITDAFSGRGGRYHALLYSGEDRSYYAIAWSRPTLVGAVADAFIACRERFGRICVLRHFSRNGCLAYALGDYDHGFGSAETRREAERIALEHCADSQSCKLEISQC